MAETLKSLGIDRLPLDERIRLAEEIWQTVEAEELASEIPDWHKQILDERVAEFETNPEEGLSWEDVKARVLKNSSRPTE